MNHVCFRLIVSRSLTFSIHKTFTFGYRATKTSFSSTTMESNEQSIVAVAQMTASSDKSNNLRTVEKLIKEASRNNAKMIFLPEACDYIAESHSQLLELAEDLNGPLIANYVQFAQKYNIWLSIGGFHNKSPSGNKIFNSHLLINSEGNICGQYDKTHLFDIEIPEKKIKLKESDYIEKGSSITAPVDTPIGKIGLSVCYDLRFPEISLSLVRMGAQILTYPSAFTVATGLAHWESLLRSRAIENQCYVVAAAQTGIHNSKRSSYGHAMVVDPWGTVIAQCREGTSIALAAVDLNYLKNLRLEMPVASHRRHDIYQLPVQDSRCMDLPSDTESFPFGQVTLRGWGVFYRGRSSIAFVNRKCVVPGHVLVIPIRRALRLTDLLPDEISDLFLTVQKVQRGMELFHQTSSSTVTVQDGPDAGQSIKHVHVHILPRRQGDFVENDQVYRELQEHDKNAVQWRSDDEMKQEATQLRHFFNISASKIHHVLCSIMF